MNKFFFIALLLCFGFSYAQESPKLPKDYNQWSIEANYGIALPTGSNPVDFIGDNGYISTAVKSGEMMSFNHFDLGVRYMFNPKWGLKLSYAHEKFQDKDISEDNLVNNRVNIEAEANLLELFGNVRRDVGNFGLFAHAGAGLIWAKPSDDFARGGTDHLGNIMLGVNPVYRLSEKFALSFDVTYTLLIEQHYSFNGQVLDNELANDYPTGEGYGRDLKPFTGGFFLFSAGIKYYIGKYRNHADWIK